MARKLCKIEKIHYTSHLEKSLRRLPKKVQLLAHKRDLIFRDDAFSPELKTHKLHGKLRHLWSYSVDRNYRVVFNFKKDFKEAIYYDIGTHRIYR